MNNSHLLYHREHQFNSTFLTTSSLPKHNLEGFPVSLTVFPTIYAARSVEY